MRIAIVGASRSRAGIGGYVARELMACESEIVAVVGRSPTSASQTAMELRHRLGVSAAPYGDVHAMLATESPDAMVICSPTPTHLEYLRAGLSGRVHVVCDKPLVGASEVAFVPPILDGFADAGRWLGTIEQWPATLDAFDRIHPGVLRDPVRSFRMWLAVSGADGERIENGAPHCLSMVDALIPDGGVLRDVRIVRVSGEVLRVHASLDHVDGHASIQLDLAPREAGSMPGYEINGHTVWRFPTGGQGYLLKDSTGLRETPLEDPLAVWIRRSLNALEAGAPDREGMLRRARWLAALWAEAPGHE